MHIHHKIPTHTTNGVANNHPDNLVELSITDHAEAHKWLFIDHGHIEDAIAWLALNGQIGKEEASRLASLAAVPRRRESLLKAISEGRAKPPTNKGMVRNEEWREKVAQSMKGNKNTTGMKWYNDGTSELRTSHEPPVGYRPGRLSNIDFRNKRFVNG